MLSWPAGTGARWEPRGWGLADGRYGTRCARCSTRCCTLNSALFLLRVGLIVLGRPGFGHQHEVRHIIAARDEARPHVSAADEQGRSSLPERQLGQHAVLPLPARGARSGQLINRSTNPLATGLGLSPTARYPRGRSR